MQTCRICQRKLPPPREHRGEIGRCPSSYEIRTDGTRRRVHSTCEVIGSIVTKLDGLVAKIDNPVALEWLAKELNAIRMKMVRRAARLRSRED